MKNSLDLLSDKLAKILGQLKEIDGVAGTLKSGGQGSSGVMGGSLAPVNTVAKPFSMGGTLMGMGQSAATGLLGVAAGASMAMPDLGLTIARRSGFYQAGVSSGGMMSHSSLESSVRLGLGKFSTSAGSDSAVAAMLTTRGMVPGSATFSSTVTAVGQAARYLNMPNEVAASAIEGLTSGPTSAMMMRNFGVFTSNPATGQAMGQGQIFEQLAQRFTGGRQTTVEGTMESLRRGNLGSNIRNSGLDSAQQALLSQYMIDRARGVNMDLSDPNAISEAIKRNEEQGISNPMLEQYRQNAKDNELMERATEPYLEGMKAASDALIVLKDAIKTLPDSIYKAKAAFDFFAGDKVGQGTIAATTSVLDSLGGMLTSGLAGYGAYKGAKSLLGGGKTDATTSPAAPAKGIKAPFVKGMGALGAVASGGMAAYNIANGGQVGSNVGMAVGTTAGTVLGGVLGSFLGPGGTILGSVAGGYLGGLAGEGIGSLFNSSGGGSTTVPGPGSENWTGAYGEQRPYGKHKGIDVGLAEGTPIKAVMDGVVSKAQSGSGERSYGLYVTIDHTGGMSTFYAHLSKILVKVGQKVKKGDIIGLSGNTGYSTGPHLHFELRVNGNHTNPSAYVNLAYGPGGTKADSSSADGSASSSSASGYVVPNNFISASWSGVSGGSSSVKDLIMAISGGSLGSLPSGSVADVPSSHGSKNGSTMMGVQLSKLLNNNAPAVGGGEEPLGVSGITSGGTGSIENSLSSRSSKANVTINLTIASASESEAKRFAKLVKQQLEEDSMLTSMGRK
jgi:murein DD-endopeptidase MepM/ murein hydrolase activator NlpD